MSFTYPKLNPAQGLEYLASLKALWSEGMTPRARVVRDESLLASGNSRAEYRESIVQSMDARLRRLAEEFPAEVSAVPGARNDFDLAASKIVFEELRALPLSVLFDRDFWRYLSVHVLFEVIAWRIPDSGKEGWPDNFGVGSQWTRCYPYKAFLRGQLINEMQEQQFPWVDVNDVDFYDSHLFGRRSGMIPSVASALNSIRRTLARSVDMRPYANTATRYRAAHLTEIISPSDAETRIRQFTEAGANE